MGDSSTQAEETRQRLIDAATREFAVNGVHAGSLLEITRQAGQRNRGAVHYHFGSREGMLVAVLETRVDYLAERERELLAIAKGKPDDLESVVQAFVRPAVELGDLGWEGRCYLVILAELAEDDRELLDPDDRHGARAHRRLGGLRAARREDATDARRAARRAPVAGHRVHPPSRRRPRPSTRAVHRPTPARDRAVHRQPGRDGDRNADISHTGYLKETQPEVSR